MTRTARVSVASSMTVLSVVALSIAGCTRQVPDARPVPKPPPRSSAPPGPAPPPEPMSGDLPTQPARALVPETCSDSCTFTVATGSRFGVARPVVAWHQAITKDARVIFPANGLVDVVGVVLTGSVAILDAARPARADSAPRTIAPWDAFRIPGGAVELLAKEASVVSLVVATGGEPLLDVAARLERGESTSAGGPIAIVSLGTSPDRSLAGGAMHARLGIETGRASLGVLLAAPTAGVPRHKHETSWEVLMALRAGGDVQMAAVPGEKELTPKRVTSGTIVAVPPATYHAWAPGGAEPLWAVQIYVPPGPEQRFKQPR